MMPPVLWHGWRKRGKRVRTMLSFSINLKLPVGDKTGLKLEDFVIVLQTPMQAEIMLKKFGEGKVVCVDATHGTNLMHTISA